MGYGIQIQSANNTLQIDSDRSLRYLKVTAEGTSTSVTTANLTDLIFMKPASFPTTATWGAFRTGSAGSWTYTFYANGVATNANYLVLRPTSVSSPSNTGYGLVLYNPEGQLAFDSGTFVSATVGRKTPQIIQVFDQNALYGDVNQSASIAYTGADYNTVYAGVNTSVVSGLGVYLECFAWVAGTTQIKFVSYFTFLSSLTYYYNSSNIMLVRLVP